MPATKNPNTTVSTGQGSQPIATVTPSALLFELEARPRDRAKEVEDHLQEYEDQLSVSLDANPGASYIGVAPVAGYDPQDVSGAGAGEKAGGLGDLTDLGVDPNLDDILTTVNTQLLRRRVFTASAARSGSTIRSADYETTSLDAMFSTLDGQVSGQDGGLFLVHALDSAVPFTYSGGTAAPRVIGESRYGGTTAPLDETSILGHVPLNPGASSAELRGTWEGFLLDPAGNEWVAGPGFEAQDCVFMDALSFQGAASAVPEARPSVFNRCYFSRTAANTTGTAFQISDFSTSNGSQAVYTSCTFAGGSAHTFLVEIIGLTTDSTDHPEKHIFRDCTFYGLGSTQTLRIDSTVTAHLVFENCRFVGDPAATQPVVYSAGNTDFINCQFSGSPLLLHKAGSGVIRDCEFYTDLDRGAVSTPVIRLTGFSDSTHYWINSSVKFAGAVGDTSNTTAMIRIEPVNTVVDGLYVDVDAATTTLPERLVHFDYDSLSNINRPSKINRVHINLNLVEVSGSSNIYPQVLYLDNQVPSFGFHYEVTDVEIRGVARGNPSGTGYQGLLCQVGPNLKVDGLVISGGMPSSTTDGHLWNQLIRLYTGAVVEGLDLRASSLSTPRGNDTIMMNDSSVLRGSFIDMSGDVSNLTAPSSIVYFLNSDYAIFENNIVYHETEKCPTISSSTLAITALSILDNKFRRRTSTPYTNTSPITFFCTLEGLNYRGNHLDLAASGPFPPGFLVNNAENLEYSLLTNNVTRMLPGSSTPSIFFYNDTGVIEDNNVIVPA